MSVQTLVWDQDCLVLLDQTRLPGEVVQLHCRDVESVAQAIERLSVRGAPAIGIAAAYGVVLGALEARRQGEAHVSQCIRQGIARLAATRPTAVNLFWALERMEAVLEHSARADVDTLCQVLLQEAHQIWHEDQQICRAIGRHGAALLPGSACVLTHCNAGGLATADYGTALAVVYAAHEQGKRVRVYADETRPLLQGARLTTWELMQQGIDVTLICDGMAAAVMRRERIDCVIVGADRIAANGDVANKIGTYGLALVARAHHVPVYVAAPRSTVDLKRATGVQIPIEERHATEITHMMGKRIAPDGVAVYNPAFDVTPNEYITAIITECGIANPPFGAALAAWMQSANP